MSSEDFKSFIVTNPDLVDEGIDISGLRTNTDASILGNIPDYGGIKYEAYNPNRLSDLMRLYSGGFPMLDVPQATQDFTGGQMIDTGGGGGMDQATGGLDAGNNLGFDSGVTPGPSGFIGLDPDMDIDPQDFAQEDYGIYDPTATTGGITGDPIEVEDLINYQDPSSSDESGLDMSGTISGAPVVGDFSEPTMGTISDDRLNEVIGGQPMAAGPFDYLQEQTPLSQVQVPGLDYSQADIDAERLGSYKPSFEPEQQGIIDQAFSKVGSTAENIMDDLSKIPGAVADFANQTVDIFGKKINVGKTLLSAGINRLAGGPITLVFDALGAIGGMLPEGGRGDVSDALGKKYGMDDIGRLTGGPMEGYSVGPDFAQTVQNRIDNINETLSNMTSEQLATTTLKDRVENLKEIKAETIAAGTGGVITEPGTVLGPGEFLPEGEDLVTVEDQLKSQPITVEKISGDYSPDDDNPADDGPAPSAPPSDPYSGGEGGVQSGMDAPSVPEADNSMPDEYDEPDYDPGPFDYQVQPTYQTGTTTRPGSGGGGGNDPSGKSIVCTAMYQTTGLEDWSKAMKIWYIYQKKYLTIQHQEGYHKLFKPFVKGMHKSQIIRAIGAHVAKHRTQDLKHIMFGSKSSWLGRVYRKILEPVCYLVGKYAK